MFWQMRRVGLETGVETGAEIEDGLTGGGIGGVVAVPRLGFPTQPLLQPVSGFSGFLALGSTRFVIFYSPGCTTGTL